MTDINDYGPSKPMEKKSLMNALSGLREKASYLGDVYLQSEALINMWKMQLPPVKGKVKVSDEPVSPVAPDILDVFYAVISEIGEKTALIQKNIEEVRQMIE